MGTSQLASATIGELREHPDNPRRTFGKDALEELVASIRTKGILNPLLVRRKGKRFEILSGARRFRAAKSAGLREVPIIVRELDDESALELMIIDNLQREDLEPLEEAEGYQALIDRAGYDVALVAERIGKSISYVYQRLKLAELVPAAKKLLAEGEITAGHAILVARLQPDGQKAAIDYLTPRWADSGLPSVRQLRRWIQEELHLKLHSAPFPKADAELVPAAGACTVCPKRTGCQPELFQDIEDADTCTDRACFNAKLEAYVERRRSELKAAGEAFVEVGDGWYYGNTKKAPLSRNAYQQLQKKTACESAERGLLVDGPRRGTLIWICRTKTCKVHGTRRDDDYSAKYRAEERRRAAKVKAERAAREQAALAIVEAIDAPKKFTRADLEASVAAFLGRLQHEQLKRVFAWMGWEPRTVKHRYHTEKDWIDVAREEMAKLPTVLDVERVLVRCALAAECEVGGYDNKKPEILEDIAGRHGIDLAALRRAHAPKKKSKKRKARKRTGKKKAS